MALTIEWKHRFESWLNELPRHFYRPLGEVPLEGYTTLLQMTPIEAQRGAFRPLPPGTAWGAKWEYGWFRGQVALPEEAAGKHITLRIDVGGESLVYVNGLAAGAVDKQHAELALTTNGRPGERYEILVEGYAGHGPRVCHAGPTPLDRETVPEPGPAQTAVGTSTFGIWEEEAYQLWIDLQTLYHVRNSIDPDSLRVAEIDRGLRDYTVLVDFELPQPEMMEGIRRCREHLKPLLACYNGSTAPLMFAFGHAHIDVAWLWPLAETERKAARTMATQLALMAQYPEYRFLQSEPHLYRMLKTHYPDIYARAKTAAQEGQLIADGGMWVEPDTNVSGGESLIRQFIHGKRFFREEMGVDNELLWLPDVFGYSGALPQIMRGCGVRYFATAKIFWAYNGGDPFPYNTFTWEGIDGSEVLVHLCNDYNSVTHPTAVIQRWNQRVQKDGISTRLFPFGYGDGGGGPTRDHLEYIRRMSDLEGVPRVRIATPTDYFRDLQVRGMPEARYVGELYFQAHRGTYTSQARTKRGNRKSELALREAEMWGAAATTLAGLAYPQAALDEAWKGVLLNQFHDILPGSSIHRVYEEAEAMYGQVLATAGEATRAATTRLAGGSGGLTVFNSLSWPRRALVALPAGWSGAASTGQALPVQHSGERSYVEVEVPSCGWAPLSPHTTTATPVAAGAVLATPRSLENEHLRIKLNDRGEIASLYDKEAGRELAAGPCNSLRMYKDVPSHWDAWDIDSTYTLTPVELAGPATFEVLAAGPLVAEVRVSRRLNQSPMTQVIRLRRGSRRIDFATTIDWQERHKLLKVAFPVHIHAHEAVHEIQFGHLRRPNHTSRPFDADRFEVCNHKWSALAEEGRGVALLNDCKYGINVVGNCLNLTLLKSALAPDMTADLGRQEVTYALYTWNGSLAQSGVVHEAYDLNCPTVTTPGAAPERSLFTLDAPNVIVEAVKPADDASGDIVIRLYEAMRTATRCTIATSLPVSSAAETDMLEAVQRQLDWHDRRLVVEFRPFEIKTLRLRLGSA